MRQGKQGRPEAALLHPLWWGSLAVMALNDHVLKALIGNAITGKLSDVAGLIVAPLLLATLVRARRRGVLIACHLAVGAVFAAIQLSPPAARSLEGLMTLLGHRWVIYSDPTDLLAMPALLVSWRVLVPAMRGPLARRAAFALTCLGALACMATSDIDEPTEDDDGCDGVGISNCDCDGYCCSDEDGDGVCAGEDCDDLDPTLQYECCTDHDADGVCVEDGDCDDTDALVGDCSGPCDQAVALLADTPTTVSLNEHNLLTASCGDGGAREAVLMHTVTGEALQRIEIVVTSAVQHQLSVRTSCSLGETELACSKDESLVLLAYPGETLFIIVEQNETPAPAPGTFLIELRSTPLVCGDGELVPPETCDDGNTQPGDGCDESCQLETR